MSANTVAHSTHRIWDVVTEIATDGSMSGKLHVNLLAGETGHLTFSTADGEWFCVSVQRASKPRSRRKLGKR